MAENNSPFLNKDFVEQAIPIDSIPEMTGVVTAGEVTATTGGDSNARTLDGYSASDFSLISHAHQMSHPYSVIGEVDDRDSFIFYFDTEGTNPIVRMAIRGVGYPARHYVDLGYHAHGQKAFAKGTHTHGYTTGAQSGDHTHTTGTESAQHTHNYQPGPSATNYTGVENSTHTHDTGGVSAGHTHSGDTGTPSTTESEDYTGVNGGTLAATLKQYGHDLTVWFDGVDVTAKWLTATGWATIGDGTGTHAFHTVGTGVVDVSAFCTWTSGLHSVEIKEPISDQGCRISLFIDTLYSVDPHAILLGTDADTLDGKHGAEFSLVGHAHPLGTSTTNKALAYRSGDQASCATGFTKVALNAEAYDIGSNMDIASNYRYTCPETGYYLVAAQVTVNDPNTASYTAAAIRKNGATCFINYAISPVETNFSIPISCVLYIVATNYLELWTWNSKVADMTVNGGLDRTFMSVHLLST